MSKRILTVFVALFVILSSFCITANAKEDENIRGINVNLPEVYCELKGSYNKSDIESAELDGEKLNVKEAYKGKDVDSKVVYLLVDISTSMDQKALNALKKDLISYATSLGSNDKFVMITFGAKMTVELKGGESNSKIKEKINAIKCNSDSTSFYDVIDKAYTMSLKETDYKRKYSIMISDGANYDKKSLNSKSETENEVKTHMLPIYGMCVESSKQEIANEFGALSRMSGGSFKKFSAKNASKQFGSLKKTINDVTCVELSGKSRKSKNGDKLLSIKANGKTFKCETVSVDAESDTNAPEAKSVTYDKDKDCFVVEFSEDVENANGIKAYTITKKKAFKDEYSDKALVIKSVKETEGNKYLIYVDGTVYNGDYKFTFNGIVDSTDNENELQNKEKDVTIDNARPIIIKILIIAAIALAPILFLLAIYLILLNIKKKKNVEKIKDIFVEQVNVEEREVEHVVIQQPKGRLIRISIDAGNGQYHTVDYNLVSSMIVGRSDMSDLRVDDMRMSKQHFVLELTDDGRLAVTDLETTNGTFVNGVRIQSRTLIQSGTKVMAGNSVIAFYM